MMEIKLSLKVNLGCCFPAGNLMPLISHLFTSQLTILLFEFFFSPGEICHNLHNVVQAVLKIYMAC